MSKPSGFIFRNECDFGALMTAQLDDYGLDPFEMRIWLRIQRRAGSGVCWETLPSMARTCLMSESRVRDAIKVLIALGMIERQERPGDSTLYIGKHPSHWAPQSKIQSIRDEALGSASKYRRRGKDLERVDDDLSSPTTNLDLPNREGVDPPVPILTGVINGSIKIDGASRTNFDGPTRTNFDGQKNTNERIPMKESHSSSIGVSEREPSEEKKGRSRKTKFTETDFNEFWKIVVPKSCRKESLKVFLGIKDNVTLEEIIQARVGQQQLHIKHKGSTEFLSRPPAWLRGAMWEDNLADLEASMGGRKNTPEPKSPIPPLYVSDGWNPYENLEKMKQREREEKEQKAHGESVSGLSGLNDSARVKLSGEVSETLKTMDLERLGGKPVRPSRFRFELPDEPPKDVGEDALLFSLTIAEAARKTKTLQSAGNQRVVQELRVRGWIEPLIEDRGLILDFRPTDTAMDAIDRAKSQEIDEDDAEIDF